MGMGAGISSQQMVMECKTDQQTADCRPNNREVACCTREVFLSSFTNLNLMSPITDLAGSLSAGKAWTCVKRSSDFGYDT